MSRLGSCSHSHRLGRVLEAWRSDSPHTFTLHTLLSVLRRAELHQAELWVRILTAPHYQQTSRAPSACSLGCSQDSLTAGLLNLSQDSGVADLSTSISSADTRSLDCVVHPCHYLHSNQQHFIYTFGYDTSLTRHSRLGRTSGTLEKWRSDSHVKSSYFNSRSHRPQKGGVFDILFKPEGKALARLSQAWIEKMKDKKRRRKCKPSLGKASTASSGLISLEKYFDNLVNILYHSTSTLSIQSI